jgi:hypothetical protein
MCGYRIGWVLVRRLKGALVVFEHSLGESDRHILDAIKRANPGRIAISISSHKSLKDIIHIKAELHKKLDQPSKLDFLRLKLIL